MTSPPVERPRLSTRMAIASSIVRLRKLVWILLTVAGAGIALIAAVLPHLQSASRRLAGTILGLSVALGLFGSLAAAILVWDRGRGLRELERDDDNSE